MFKKQASGKPLSDGAFRALLDRMGVSSFTPHGFRSSFRDWAAEVSKESRDVIEMALSHSVGSMSERAYLRSDQLEKRRLLHESWSHFVAIKSN